MFLLEDFRAVILVDLWLASLKIYNQTTNFLLFASLLNGKFEALIFGELDVSIGAFQNSVTV